MNAKSYATPPAFRRALEDRLLKMAQEEHLDLPRLRRQVVFDRLLCRLFRSADSPWLLKGGYAMELRLATARTTRDIDLAIRSEKKQVWDPEQIQRALETAAALDLGDYFIFRVGAATLDLEAAPYGGARYPVEAELAGRSFAKFHVDVSSGDVLREPYENLSGQDWLAFAGISTRTFPTISPEEQFAEKLHAYTFPRKERPNSRVKDLIDMSLLIQRGLDDKRLAQSIRETFQRRKTHAVPSTLAKPPSEWSEPFAALASECGVAEDITVHWESVQSQFQKIMK